MAVKMQSREEREQELRSLCRDIGKPLPDYVQQGWNRAARRHGMREFRNQMKRK